MTEVISLAEVRKKKGRLRAERPLSPYARMTDAEKEREISRLIHEIAVEWGLVVPRPGGANR